MNKFMHGTKLAVFQDFWIKKLLKRFVNQDFVSDEQLKEEQNIAEEMSKNLWVKIARKIAPNNLVLRHYCLIDILNGKPDNYDKIYKLINQLSPVSPNGRLWLEGYTYWLYCKNLLVFYSDFFEKKHRCNISIPLSLIVVEIDNCFQKISYSDYLDVLYPAPFGDLRKVSLENHLQDEKVCIPNISIYPVKKMSNDGKLSYEVKKSLLGLNTHVPDKTYKVEIGNVLIENFRFYYGFENKYESKYEEFKDTFRIDRVLSALKLLIKN